MNAPISDLWFFELKKFAEFLIEPTDGPTSEASRVNWLYIFLVKVGVFISLPGFLTGVKVGNAVGFNSSVVAFVVGGIVLGILASLTGYIGSRTNLTTYLINQHTFGRKGALLVNLVLAAALFGWFGVNTALFGSAVVGAIADTEGAGQELWSIIGGILMIATAIFGFKALDRFSRLAVPLLFLGLYILVDRSLGTYGLEAVQAVEGDGMSIGKAISAVIGGSVVGIVVFPDLCRYAKSNWHAIVAAILVFSVSKPLVSMAAAIPSLASGMSDIIAIMDVLGMGMIAFFVIIFATWTSNNGNLYGASLSLSTIFPKIKYWRLVIISGVLGTLFAITGVTSYYLPFLQVLGILIPPVAGIYIMEFLIRKGDGYEVEALARRASVSYDALAAWVLASVVGALAQFDVIVISTVPGLDSLIVGGAIFVLLRFLGNRAAQRDALSD